MVTRATGRYHRATASTFSRTLAICLAILIARSGPALAEDPPLRVGSLNYISGVVRFSLRSESGEPGTTDGLSWKDADFNQPVCQDMSLQTGALARARIRIGPDAIQMSNDTVLHMLNLSEQLIEASIRQGRIYLQLGQLGPGERVELEIPRGSLWLLQAGSYDIEAGSAEQPARIVVHDGKARFVGGQADIAIGAGEEAQVAGTYPAVTANLHSSTIAAPAAAAAPITTTATRRSGQTDPSNPTDPANQASISQAAAQPAPAEPGRIADGGPPGPPIQSSPPSAPPRVQLASAEQGAAGGQSDDFLFWAQQSNDATGHSQSRQSARYVSTETTGYDELDRYGNWQTLPDAGAVWFPSSVPPDWAPYRFGHWDSIAPWGWTWVDDQPWGFAPFHFGRWINVDGRWGWVPGAIDPHPVYAPALVAFIAPPDDAGAGPNDQPNVGWFPLGPGDAYAPWYAAGPAYVERVNVVVREGFRGGPIGGGRAAWRAERFNRQFATVVPRGAFGGGHPVDRAMLHVPATRLATAAVMRGAPRVPIEARARPETGPGGMRGEPRGATPVSTGPGGRPGGHPPIQHEAGHGGFGSGGRGAEMHPGGASPPHSGGQNFGHPEFGRPEAGRNPGVGYRGGAQQFGRPPGSPAMSGAFRGGQAFGRPQGFQTPMASRGGFGGFGGGINRGGFGGTAGHAAPATHFGGGGGGGHHR